MWRGAETLFLGSFTNKIDAKGRLATPARFRRVLELEKSTTIFVIPSPDEDCLEAGGPRFIEELAQQIFDLPPYSDERRILQQNVLGEALSLNLDGEGRIVLPKELREQYAMNGEAAFSGQGTYFQIWNPAALGAARGDRAEVAAARKRLQNASANGGGV